jgi:hypothetical protein
MAANIAEVTADMSTLQKQFRGHDGGYTGTEWIDKRKNSVILHGLDEPKGDTKDIRKQ